jgi:hypothetical protein
VLSPVTVPERSDEVPDEVLPDAAVALSSAVASEVSLSPLLPMQPSGERRPQARLSERIEEMGDLARCVMAVLLEIGRRRGFGVR